LNQLIGLTKEAGEAWIRRRLGGTATGDVMEADALAGSGAGVAVAANAPPLGALAAAAATQDLRREHTRESLLQAAWTALARDGYEKITTRRIAEIAGVNIATLHYYFGTKEALLSEATRFALRATEARLRSAIDAEASATAAFERVFATIWQLVQERTGVLRYDLAVRGFRDPGARGDVLEMYERYRAITEDLVLWRLREGGRLAPGLSAAGLAHYMLCSVDGVILQHVLTGDDDAAQGALDMIRRHTLMLLDTPAGAGTDQ
jgi:AcrR family transcriptional regulator